MFSSIINSSDFTTFLGAIITSIGLIVREYFARSISFNKRFSKRVTFLIIGISCSIITFAEHFILPKISFLSLYQGEFLIILLVFAVSSYVFEASILEISAQLMLMQLCSSVITALASIAYSAATNQSTLLLLGEISTKTYNSDQIILFTFLGTSVGVASSFIGAYIYNLKLLRKIAKPLGIIYILASGGNAIIYSLLDEDPSNTDLRLAVWFVIMSLSAVIIISVTAYNNKQLNAQMEMQSAYYEKYASNQEVIRRMNHDIKNHMHTISYMLKDSDNMQAINYANELEKEYSAVRISFSENKILDAVFTLKYNEAIESGIEAEFVSHISGELKISNKDLSALLSNLLDNAIEACKRNKNAQNKITASVSKQNENLFIKVSNTFNEEENSKKSKFFSTLKDDKFSHGLGTKIIKSVVSKYKGSMKTTNDNGLFTVIVIIADLSFSERF